MEANIRPTAEQACQYLHQQFNETDRQFFPHDGKIMEKFDGQQPTIYAHIEELHWMKDNKIGVRGFDLMAASTSWPFKQDGSLRMANRIIAPTVIKQVVEEHEAVHAKKSKAEKGPSKLDQARIIYDDLAGKGHGRKDTIQRFIDVLNMTPAGASTYFANIKKERS